MVTIYIFACSGLSILVLIASKHIEETWHREIFITRAISRGDTRMRQWSNTLTHFYSWAKDRTLFLVKKQIPLKIRSWSNRSRAFLREKFEEKVGNIRNSKLLKKREGISEYFKSLSEKDSGRIDDVFEDKETEGE